MAVMSPHTVRSFDDELAKLQQLISRMGEFAGRQIRDVAQALVTRNSALAGEIATRDLELDQLEREIEAQAIRVLALRQPVAQDLRYVVAALKVATDIERIGDYAANAAKRTVVLCSFPPVGSLNGFERMATLVQANLSAAVRAFVTGDSEAADRVWAADTPVDTIHTGIFRELLTHMIEDSRTITPAVHLLFIAKNLERIGDHATNIAESAHFAVRGDLLPDQRPKADHASEATVADAKS